MELDIWYSDINAIRSSTQEWMIYGSSSIRQFAYLMQHPEEQSSHFVVWIYNNENLDVRSVVSFLADHFQYTEESSMHLAEHITDVAIIAITNSRSNLDNIHRQAPTGLRVRFCSFDTFHKNSFL